METIPGLKRINNKPIKPVNWRGIPVGFQKPERKQYVVKKGIKSHYHIVINSNKADDKLSEEDRKQYIEKAKTCLLQVKHELDRGMHRKFGDGRLINYQFNLEVGKIVKRLHFDGLISFESFVLLDLNSIRTLLKDHLGKVYFFANVIPDSIGSAIKYSEKDNMRII